MSDPMLASIGVVTAALRDDGDGVQALFVGLDAEDALTVAVAALIGMGEAVRAACPPQCIEDMIRTLQRIALEEGARP